MATVSALVYYPVKGFAGIALDEAEVTGTGLLDDRLLMVVSADDGVFLSQRTHPAMAAVRPAPVPGGLRLAAGGTDVEIEITPDGPRRAVSLFGHWFGEGVDQGERAAEWCSEVLGAAVRLVRVTPEHDRDGWGLHPGKVGFGDAHALLLTSESSLDSLNGRIAATGAAPVPMDRFRPNVVVTGWAEPHTEDRVRRLRVGSATLGYSTRAIRCAVPTVDQRTGVRSGPEPVRTLAAYRREPEFDNRVSFGAKLAVLAPGAVAVGDPVAVDEWG
ncbi:Flavodoxin reductases (ferredoxin-NADPH reductases) family 1 [Actinokineospora spheciospongiae]|uniref:Flavodoxin reductases (Ferredoxin-NADPH reductases) family 1 n=1 Tax=Actinokineospora spheciospongiae TaxID=909613 RepID=W7IJM0_9PSEU|nr:MOSC N-terminal beta barrel domain-containing protein [Actinokineospora spheciospongiae]EWC60558.1 Flavodoxin reductases (ferredoxin-NADPH reductases) family 1 [Actinokineospora spheciospongiae]